MAAVTTPALRSTSLRAYERVMRENRDVVPLMGVPPDSAGITLSPQAPSPPGWRPAAPRRPLGR